MPTKTFRFRWATSYRLLALPFGVTPDNAVVTIDGDVLTARFGRWTVRTAVSNVTGVERSGPYGLVKTAGPVRLSASDRGLTMATNGESGLCLKFREPVKGIEPTGRLRHPGLTLTVEDVDGLARALGH